MKRNVAITGVGQTYHRGRRPDVNEPELCWESVEDALNDSGLDMSDIECVVHGNMELFEGVHQPDMWHAMGDGATMNSGFRVTTGGTTGSTIACAAINLVASGLYDTVMAVGFEKQEEGQTTTGITAMADPLWGREVQTGAIVGATGLKWVEKFGERAEWAAAKIRVKAANNAKLNPKSHLKLDITEDDVMNSRLLATPLRLLHMCPESNGSCAVIFTTEEKARRNPQKPVWVRDHVTVHREDGVNYAGPRPSKMSHGVAAKKLYARNNISDPLKEIDFFEMYDPSSWWELDWTCEFTGRDMETILDMTEKGEFEINGAWPINPGGGVQSTNPIGATALIRTAEAALQVRGDAGAHQIPKNVNTAMSSGFGGTYWTVLFLYTKEL